MATTKPVRALLDAIGKVEAGSAGYNAIYLPAAKTLGPYKLTAMTIKEIQALQADMVKSSASSAVGRYQFIRKTLAALVKKLGISSEAKFTEALQDRFALRLVNDRGLPAFLSGKLSREDFANNLAKEWASLPVVTPINGKKVGQSYYAGDGLNHALMKPARILALVDGLKVVPTPKPKPAPEPPPEPVPAPVPPPEYDREVVRNVQTMLLGHGYTNVGGIDGLVGDMTRSAIRDFRAGNGLPAGDHIDVELIEALKRPDAVRPVIAPERAEATLDELAEKGSEIADAAKKGKKGAIATFFAAIGTMIASISERIGDLVHFGPLLETLRPYFEAYGPYLMGTALLLLAGFIYYQSRKSGNARVRDHATGNTSVVNLPAHVEK